MTRFDWDGLRPGDRVAVQRTSTAHIEAHTGTVRFVREHRRGNDVGIRLDDDQSVVWSTWSAVDRVTSPEPALA